MDLEKDVRRATEDLPVERLPPLNYHVTSRDVTKSKIPVPVREKPPSPGPGRLEGMVINYD